ncbi:hypothetical protein FQA39_LY08129 [Lamprigera yunnana]|nr:hypothetical protein FQA39_LY08129 [Lamprigera yunnana]
MFVIPCIIFLDAVLGVNCIGLQIWNNNNYEDCLLGVINQNFKEDETLYFVTSENYTTMPFEKLINPYVVVNISKPIELKLKIARNFIILTKNKNTLKKLLSALRNSAVWSETQSASGKFLIISSTKVPSSVFHTVWTERIIDVVVLLPSSRNNHSLYVANPFENGNNCGKTPVAITEQSCSAPLIKSVKIPLKNLGGWTELSNSLNGTLCFDDKDIKEVNYSIAISAFFYLHFDLYDTSKVIHQIDWLWIAPPPIRDFPIETITMLFQIEVWLLTGFTFVFTIVVWWFAIALKMSSNFSQFCYVSITVISLTLCGTVSSIPKMKILRYIFIIYSTYVVLMHTAFKTNLVYVLTSLGYSGIVTNAKELVDLELPVCCSRTINHKDYLLSYTSDSTTFRKFKKLMTTCECYPNCFDVIYDYRNITVLMLKSSYYSLQQHEKRPFQVFIDNSLNNDMKIAFIVRKGHYFIKNLDWMITTLKESGIYQKQMKNFYPIVKEDALDETPIPLNMEHMIFTFILLIVGLVLSFIVFIIECVYHKYRNNN